MDTAVEHHIAELNIGRARFDLDDPRIAVALGLRRVSACILIAPDKAGTALGKRVRF
ncbi:MAG: hypothetical protein AAFV62_07835 [Pseudomonadota bacterium]